MMYPLCIVAFAQLSPYQAFVQTVKKWMCLSLHNREYCAVNVTRDSKIVFCNSSTSESDSHESRCQRWLNGMA